jgi:hypothetical protein
VKPFSKDLLEMTQKSIAKSSCHLLTQLRPAIGLLCGLRNLMKNKLHRTLLMSTTHTLLMALLMKMSSQIATKRSATKLAGLMGLPIMVKSILASVMKSTLPKLTISLSKRVQQQLLDMSMPTEFKLLGT